MVWADFRTDLVLASATQSFVDILQSAVIPERTGMTLVRTLIRMEYRLSIAGSGGFFDVALSIMDLDALSAGAGPDPADSAEQPGWTWREHVAISSSLVNDNSQAVILTADVKSRRRFRGENFTYVLNHDMGVLSSSINADGMIRSLWMKP